MAMRGPAMIPKLFAVIGDDDNQRIVQDAKLFELGDQQLQTRIGVQDLSVVTVDPPLDEFVGIDAILQATIPAHHRAAAVLTLIAEVRVVAIELRWFRRLGALLLKTSRRAVWRVRISGMRI